MITFTCSVYWREDENLEWRNRWNVYFVASNDSANVHWLAILNSLIITGCLHQLACINIIRQYKEAKEEAGCEYELGARAYDSREETGVGRHAEDVPMDELPTSQVFFVIVERLTAPSMSSIGPT
ncbi:Transmembrane 9 superfamily member 7 [Paraphaeosphaeria minitans]|uniref:Transmembrane 9 superfamily member 7 n=1 Tax=Paraphaeosphaeria minitans TaxID=565426 RepID=A0A9P6G5V1_9PLEO|nr:Transmembrane 9 superfamily member 7 [Paraphaeosphaeria minitans]